MRHILRWDMISAGPIVAKDVMKELSKEHNFTIIDSHLVTVADCCLYEIETDEDWKPAFLPCYVEVVSSQNPELGDKWFKHLSEYGQ